MLLCRILSERYFSVFGGQGREVRYPPVKGAGERHESARARIVHQKMTQSLYYLLCFEYFSTQTEVDTTA